MQKLIVLMFFFGSLLAKASDGYPKNEAIDILHYRFQLELNDSTDDIVGQATITILFKKSISEFELDLTNKNSQGMGMTIDKIFLN